MALNPKEKMLRKARASSTPQVAFYGRILGGVEYVCPFCSRFQHVTTVNWRKPRAQCTNHSCKRKVEFGLMVSLKLQWNLSPFNAVFYGEKPQKVVNNQVVPPVGLQKTCGQIIGSVEWWCPQCSCRNHRPLTPFLGSMACSQCGNVLYAALAMYSTTRAHARTPVDWIPPSTEGVM